MKTTVISLGGSIVVPDKIDIMFLKRFRKLIMEHVKKGHRVVLVVGGGRPCRLYQEAAGKLVHATTEDKDWIGIMATRLNAELVRVMFKDVAYHRVIYDPHEKVKTDKKVIIGAGHKPGCTTDYDMAVLAKGMKADLLINTTNVDYVYDKDPRVHRDAKKIEHTTWKEFNRMFKEHKAGIHAPFDPVASRFAEKTRLTVAIVNGRNLANLKRLLDGKRCKGTVIKPK
ncbi:TPA: UMP kinase [Candidatus Woesearchaeota archaeon]|nr:UMP kinase [Candidatus Woesearchaeota archaeon]